jgi:lysine 2,3-aminomutase
VPINPNYVVYHDSEKIMIRNYEGKIFEYPEPVSIQATNHHGAELFTA